MSIKPEIFDTQHHVAQGNYRMRPLQESDRFYVLDLFDHLSAQSRYFRYCQPLKNLPESLLNSIINANKDDDMAIGAFLLDNYGNDQTLIGIARYVKEIAPGEAEFSLSVRDDFHHEGIGSHLMKLMLGVAAANGFNTIHGYVMVENQDMLHLMRQLGANCTIHEDDHSTMITSFHLRAQ